MFVGMHLDAAQMVNAILNGEPFAAGGAMNTTAGSFQNLLGDKTYYASTSVVQGRVGFGDIASVGASALSATVHAECGSNNYSVSANVSMVRVDGNLGPFQISAGLSFDTHISLGRDRVSASFLGMGFSCGRCSGVQTPVFDCYITL